MEARDLPPHVMHGHASVAVSSAKTVIPSLDNLFLDDDLIAAEEEQEVDEELAVEEDADIAGDEDEDEDGDDDE